MFILDTDHLTIVQRQTEPAYTNLSDLRQVSGLEVENWSESLYFL